MIKYRDLTYVGEVRFDAIKAIIVKDNEISEIRYSFMLHFDDSEDNDDPKNAAIISWVEHYICELFKCESSRDCDPGDIIFHNFTPSDAIAWNRMDTIAGRNNLIEIGINIVNITTRIYNFTTE